AEHVADFKAWQRDQALAPAPAQDAWVEDQKAQQAMKTNVASFAQKAGLAPDEVQRLAPFMDKALEGMHPSVINLTVSEDPDAREAGFQILFDRAAILAGDTPAPAPASAAAAEPSVIERKLAGARGATGALRPAPKREVDPASPEARAEAISAFKRGIMEVETTDVRSGLTFGQGPPQPGR